MRPPTKPMQHRGRELADQHQLALGTIHLVVDAVAKGRVTTVGLDLADDAADGPTAEEGPAAWLGSAIKQMLARLDPRASR
jgi:hypothetical protein